MKEERERGALTYLQKLHEEQGLFLLGRTNCIREPVFYVSTMRAVQKPEDFNGLRAGITSTVFDAFCRALGMTSNFVRFADLYTALERGMIDTIPLTLDTMLQYGLAEMKGLMTVDHPFYLSNNVTLINLDKWKTLPKHLKDLILKAQLEFEPQNEKVEAAFANRYKQKFMDAGIKFIQFSPSDAKRFVDLAYSAQWQKLLKEQPETVTKLKSMLSK
jgi:TRAP-type C4-dicarboxylate transport system substrate-binding protein